MLLQQHSSLHSLPSKEAFFSAGSRQFRLGCCVVLGKGDDKGGSHSAGFLISAFSPPRPFFWAVGVEDAKGCASPRGGDQYLNQP